MAHWLGLPRYEAERVGLLSSLKRRAEIVAESLDALEGVTCRMSDGALYAFPAIDLPVKFLEEATAAGEAADGLFCMRLLDATGVVVVPGSGFGQKEVKQLVYGGHFGSSRSACCTIQCALPALMTW